MKRLAVTTLLLAPGLFAALSAPAKVDPEIDKLEPFARAAAHALDDVGHLGDKMSLNWYLGAPQSKEPFTLFGVPPTEPVALECSSQRVFMILVNESEQARFNFGLCKGDPAKLRHFMASIEATSKKLTDELGAGQKPEAAEKLRRMFVSHAATTKDGRAARGFVVPLIGHGVIFINTALVSNAKTGDVIAIQADLSSLCGDSRPDGKAPFDTVLCTDRNRTLMEVAVRLAQSYPAATEKR